MKEGDGIVISDRPTWALSFEELRRILVKRIIALPSKLIGFKPFCLFVATWLLIDGKIDMWVWFLVFVSVLFGVVGLKVAMRYRETTGKGGGDGGVVDAVCTVVGRCGGGTPGSAGVSGAEESARSAYDGSGRGEGR